MKSSLKVFLYNCLSTYQIVQICKIIWKHSRIASGGVQLCPKAVSLHPLMGNEWNCSSQSICKRYSTGIDWLRWDTAQWLHWLTGKRTNERFSSKRRQKEKGFHSVPFGSTKPPRDHFFKKVHKVCECKIHFTLHLEIGLCYWIQLTLSCRLFV